MSKTIEINGRTIGREFQPYIIAEMACAHDGDADKAKALVDAAVKGGADAVQLQFFDREALMTPQHNVFELLGKIQFSPETWREIYDYARQFPIDVLVCTFDLPSFELADKLGADGIKLNSSDLSNQELMERVAKSTIPFTIGTGASTVEEIAKAVELTQASGNRNMVIMHGIQNFPTPSDEAHINKVALLNELFPFPVGYADHTDADDPFSRTIDLLALGAGATVMEKHITLDRSEKGTDYQAALEPDEFATYVKLIRQASLAMGKNHWPPLGESDLKYREFQKKNVVTLRDMPAGTVLSREDLAFKRTGQITSLNPGDIQSILGTTLTRAVPVHHPLDWGDFR